MTTNSEGQTLITDAMRAWVGSKTPPLTSPPISESDIRRAAISIYWPEIPPRVYWDTDHAATTRWGGIIAPEEFNPFAWMIGRAHVGPQPDRLSDSQVELEDARNLRPPGAPPRFLFGGVDSTYHARMRPGDVITSVITATDVYGRSGSIGPMLFYITEETWTKQNGEVVKTTRTTNIAW